MNIREPTAADFPLVRSMLEDAGLPTDDLVPEHLAFVAEDGGRVVAAIGFERFDGIGLLRSLVVEEGARFRGLGRRLVSTLEAHAREQGIREVWLLTLGVDRYFLALGYAIRNRADVPPPIGQTPEFAELCSDDATLMSKTLA